MNTKFFFGVAVGVFLSLLLFTVSTAFAADTPHQNEGSWNFDFCSTVTAVNTSVNSVVTSSTVITPISFTKTAVPPFVPPIFTEIPPVYFTNTPVPPTSIPTEEPTGIPIEECNNPNQDKDSNEDCDAGKGNNK